MGAEAAAPTAEASDAPSVAPARSRVAGLLCTAVLVATAVTLALSLFVPIYHDEVGWKIYQARLARDGGVNIHVLPTCTASFAIAPPIYMVPFRWLDELVYGDLSWPLKLRLFGIATHLAWLAILLLGLARALDPVIDRRLLVGAVLAAVGLGTLPFLLVLNRPEQLLLVGATAFAFAPFLFGRGSKVGWRLWARAALLVLAATGLAAAHPKAVFLLPVVVVGIAGTLEPRALRWLSLAAVVTVGLASAHFWRERFACADDPSAASKLRSGLALDELAAGRGLGLVRLALDAELRDDIGFSRQIRFGGDGWNWLQPEARVRTIERIVNRSVQLFCGLLAVGVALAAIATAARVVRSRRLDARAAATLALVLPLTALFLLELRRASYEAGFLIALAIVTVALNVPAPRPGARRSVFRFAALALMLFALASQAALWRRFAPRVAVVRAAEGYLPGQALSFSPFRSELVRSKVVAAASRCGIDASRPLEGLVLDDVTYPAFQGSRRPLHIFYLVPPWGESLVDLERFLAERRSAGIVVGCRHVPMELRSRAERSGAICCLPRFGD